MTKSIVTGGAGFIGSHIVDKLVELGHHVTVIDNMSSTVHDDFYINDNADYYVVNIANYEQSRPLYDNVDYVFHCAAESRIQPCIDNPLLAMGTNFYGTGVVLQCAREAGVKKVLYSSTSSGYGLKNFMPLDENMPDDCLNPYSVSKVSAEKVCKMYSDLFQLETVIFRYFNVYGPREPLKGPYAPVIGLFLRQHKAGQSLTIVGDGEQRRDFTHVNDVVEANLLAMNSQVSGELINIGSGINYSVKQIADAISSDQLHIDPRLGEARETLANINKARSLLNWTPKHNIIDYIKEQLK
mgnify:CR=1 FL=1